MHSSDDSQHGSVIDALLNLARRARRAESSAELGFVAVNETHALAPYRQAALWFSSGGVVALSGVVTPEANAPFVHWLDRVASKLSIDAASPQTITPELLLQQDAAEWDEWLPAQALWLPLQLPGVALPNSVKNHGGLLLARDEPWTTSEVALLAEWSDIWAHAWAAKHKPSHTLNLFRWLQRPRGADVKIVQVPLRQRWAHALQPANFGATVRSIAIWPRTFSTAVWRSPGKRYATLVLLCALIPVRLTVLVPGELMPAQPAAIRSPQDGTVDRFFVAPNAKVKTGDPLFQLDGTSLSSKLAVALEGLATAEAEYRQTAQQAVFDARSKPQLALLQGRVSERSTEAEYFKAQLMRAKVVAPRDGIALVDDPTEWIGKPVATGERVMTVADEHDVEVEAWLSPSDIIDLQSDAPVTLYLNSAPLDPVYATLRYVAHEATLRPDGSFAYRLRATLPANEVHPRIGLKGTARVSGHYVPVIYWVLRRPLATIRPFIGF